MSDEDLTKPVTIEIDTPDAGTATTDVKPEGAKAVAAESPLADQFEAMKKNAADATARATAAERRAGEEAAARQRAEADAAGARTEAADGRLNTIARAMEAKSAIIAQAENEYQNALSAGNFAEATKINSRLSKATAELVRLEEAKADAEERNANPRTEGAVRPQPQTQTQTVEGYIDSLQTDQRSKAWLRAHPECISDRRLNHKMIAAHNEAMSEDMRPGTEEYLEYIETRLGFRGAEGEGEVTPARTQPAARRTAAVSAPVSRDSTSMTGATRNGRKVTLTPAERDAARFSGITETEYARQKLLAEEAGDFTRMN